MGDLDCDLSVVTTAGGEIVCYQEQSTANPSLSNFRWKNLLADALSDVEVVTFDYPYNSKRKPPPKAEKLVEFHSEIVKKIAAKYPEHPLILVGKSMGSSYAVFF